jgi:hypothetical protein
MVPGLTGLPAECFFSDSCFSVSSQEDRLVKTIYPQSILPGCLHRRGHSCRGCYFNRSCPGKVGLAPQ